MWRTLRAFAWLRWRMFVNSLEKTGARDTVERFSLAIEKLGPIIAGLLMIPSGLLLAVAGVYGGYQLARGAHPSMMFEAMRYLLLAVPVFSIIGPLLLPAADRTNPVRLLLLPISRNTLYVAQSASAFGDVWVLIMLPILSAVPVGMALGGATGGALLALAGGVLLTIVVIGISSLTTSLLHLAVRDRRRGELLALLFILIIPMVSMLPGLLQGDRRSRGRAEARPPARERVTLPPWAAAAGQRAFALYPTELYTASTRAAARGDAGAAGSSLAALTGSALLLHAIGMFAFARVLESPGSTGARRAVPMRHAWGRTLPGLSSGASAVALAQVRLALRTPRGRSILLSPVLMLFIFGYVMRRNAEGMELGMFTLQSGLGLASFGSFICLMSTLPIAMNQFAVDRAGVTMALLSPLTDGEYLAGKAVGNALIAAPPAVLCVVASFLFFPGGPLALWAAIPLALLSTSLLVAPLAAIFSAIFPRVVDMNSIGRGSNAHGLSGLLGVLAFVAAGAPSLLIALAASRWLQRPSLAPLLLLGWCGVTYAISRLLFVPARAIFASRRENLATLTNH
jgi:hypothetical protein